MEWRLELVQVPVSNVDRAKAFYTEQVGFNADHDHRVDDEIRFVQLTPPGSGCSIAIGTGLGGDMQPGSPTRTATAGPSRRSLLAGSGQAGTNGSLSANRRWISARACRARSRAGSGATGAPSTSTCGEPRTNRFSSLYSLAGAV